MKRAVARLVVICVVIAGLIAFGITVPVPSSATFAQSSATPAVAGPASTPNVISVPQDPTKNPRSPDYNPRWGTADAAIRQVAAYQFVAIDTTITYSWSGGMRYRSGGTAFWFEASVSLPSGAKLSALELYACDTDAATGTAGDIYAWVQVNGTTAFGGQLTTGAPGCGYYSYDLTAANITVDNFLNSYNIEVRLSSATSANRFREANLYYFQQVSPAPATASFTDVPTSHAFFQYIEALKASGITAGCTATTYCPDATLTRGQMAVFLSRALGLHWSP